MNQTPTANRVALLALLICIAVAAVVVAFEPGVLRDPLRLGILGFVVLTVPAGNWIMARRRSRIAR